MIVDPKADFTLATIKESYTNVQKFPTGKEMSLPSPWDY